MQIITTSIIAFLVTKIFGNTATAAEAAQVHKECENPAVMSDQVFLALQDTEESMERSAAQGQDCNEGFDETRKEVNRLLDASPWQMHPDHGCVRTALVENLDRMISQAG